MTNKTISHTPGPWRAYISEHNTIEIEDKNQDIIISWAGFDSCHKIIPERKANAHLIAAAPEMLEALTECRDVLSKLAQTGKIKGMDELEKYALHGADVADAVISKAEGRS